jgi:vacuolar-type H+-ATPase subunit H
MHNAIKTIRGVEGEAREILDQAKLQADMIINKTENNLPSVYREAYEESISEAKNRSVELIGKTKKNAERLLQNILSTSKKQIERVQGNARKNFDSAVDFIFNLITSSRT